MIEKDGSVASALINAATLALIDAGIEMNDMVSSCSVSLHADTIIVDPCATEEKSQRASAVVAVSPIRGTITFIDTSGPWTEASWNDALKTAIIACTQLDVTVREWLKASVGELQQQQQQQQQ